MTTKPTYNHIPALRFPDFVNDGEWEEAKVGDVINTLTPPKKLNSSEYEKTGKFPIIDQSQNFICGYSDDEDALMNHNNEDLIVFGDHTCVLKFVSFPFIQGADGIKIIKSKDSNKLVESFLFQSLLNNPVVSREYKRHFSELKEKELYFSHSIAEQQKIASCLFSMDAYISATKAKLELLKTYKKGLMQKLFPAKGKKLPELRFKEFEKDGEWEEKKLGEFLFEHKMKSDGHCQVYSVSVSKGVINQIEYLGRSFSASDTSNYKLVKPYDIIYTKSPTGIFPFGIVKQSFVNHNVIVSPLYGVFSPVNQYIGYIIHSYFESPERTNNYLAPIVQKGAKNTIQITNEIFLSQSVCFPSKFEEQCKIADCLTSIDNMINQYTNEVALLELYKKGLMQQMFPTSK